ncbi:hypothetical protein PCL_03760 [Purpureocillium lilacinum]|uniref:Uncharacterized protein n=1 Tax=Purpureocillium lilacinum TaxID=33203 RepID=A0A2U3EPX8_PURLI|nr:hypothetical protein PCL_03760 [Purpureocillium lilacinum]
MNAAHSTKSSVARWVLFRVDDERHLHPYLTHLTHTHTTHPPTRLCEYSVYYMPRPAFSAVEQKRVTTKDPPPDACRTVRAHLTDARVGRPYCPSLPRTLISSTHTDTLRACNTIATPGLRKPWYGLVVFSGRYATERTHSRAAPISRSRPSPGDTQHRTIIIVIIIVSLGKLIGSSSHPHDSSSGVAEAAIACPPAGRQTRPSPRLTYLHISRIHTSPLHASPRNRSLRELPPPPQKVRAKHSSLYEYNRPSAHRIASISVRLIIAHDTHPHLDKEGHEPGYASGTRHESRRSGPSSWPLQRRAPSAMWKYLHGIDRTGAARARVCQDDT